MVTLHFNSVEELAEYLSWVGEYCWYGNGRHGKPYDCARRQQAEKHLLETLKNSQVQANNKNEELYATNTDHPRNPGLPGLETSNSETV